RAHGRIVDGREQAAAHRIVGDGDRNCDVDRNRAGTAGGQSDREEFGEDVGPVCGKDADVAPRRHRAAGDARLDAAVDVVEGDDAGAADIDGTAAGAAGRDADRDAGRRDVHLVRAGFVVG